MTDILELIQKDYCKLSKSHKKIADYILANYEKAVFMTVNELSTAVNCGEATVVRFTTRLGFNGYSGFQNALTTWVSSLVEKKKDITYKVKISSIPDTLKAVFEKDISNLKSTMEEFDIDAFNQAVNYIVSAKKIFILGLKSSKTIAEILSIYLNMIRDNVSLISTNITSEIFEQMIHISENDLLISVGFPDYSVRNIKAMEFAHSKNTRIISITDSLYSPMSMYTSCVLTAKCDLTDDVVSLTSAMSLLNALVLAVINNSGDSYKNNIAALNDAVLNIE